MNTITNPAPAALATVIVHTDSGPIATPCEPIDEWLAIVPAVGMDAEGRSWLLGAFTIVHRREGLFVAEGAGCIACCRNSGGKLADLESANWSTLTAENSAEWVATLTEEDRLTLATARALEWGCDAEYCTQVDDFYKPAEG